VLPEFRISARNLPGIHVVALHGDLDITSADGLVEVLAEATITDVVQPGMTCMDSMGGGRSSALLPRARSEFDE
jgi:hypothetical protein